METNNTFPHSLFKFQANNIMGLKALIYGELFFSAKDELNDPYDTKLPFVFSNDKQKYFRLIKNFMAQDNQVSNILYPFSERIDTNLIADYLSSKELLYDELINIIESKKFEEVVNNAFSKIGILESIGLSIIFIRHFKKHIQVKLGAHAYIISFTKAFNDPVMWSHYANQHKGFCLCFNINNNYIISRKNGNKKLKNEYQLHKVDYKKNNLITDAFYGFPESVNGSPVSKKEIENHWGNVQKSFLTKYKSWAYEDEYRILEYNPFSAEVNSSGVKKIASNERIFYFEPSQLNGIIFGSRINHSDKDEIISIVRNTRNKSLLKNEVLPDLFFYDSFEHTSNYLMDIKLSFGLNNENHKI